MKRKLTPRVLLAAVAGGVLVYALVFWFVLVSPKRAEAASLKEDVAALQATVAAARLAATPRSNEDTRPIAVADIFRLAKAMPSAPDMPGILLELSRIAEETGVEFQSVTPLASTVAGDFQDRADHARLRRRPSSQTSSSGCGRWSASARASSAPPAGSLRSSRSRFPSPRRDSPSSRRRSPSSRTSTGTTSRPAPARPAATTPAADPNTATPAPAPAAEPTGAEASP